MIQVTLDEGSVFDLDADLIDYDESRLVLYKAGVLVAVFRDNWASAIVENDEPVEDEDLDDDEYEDVQLPATAEEPLALDIA